MVKEFVYPVSINGKPRAEIALPYDTEEDAAATAVRGNEVIAKWLNGKQQVRIIFIKHRMINVVA